MRASHQPSTHVCYLTYVYQLPKFTSFIVILLIILNINLVVVGCLHIWVKVDPKRNAQMEYQKRHCAPKSPKMAQIMEIRYRISKRTKGMLNASSRHLRAEDTARGLHLHLPDGNAFYGKTYEITCGA